MVALAVAVAVAPAAAGSASPAHRAHLDPGLAGTVSGSVQVIVQAERGALAAARSAVRKVHGSIWSMLPIVDGFSATVPASALGELAHDPAVHAVTADRTAHLVEMTWRRRPDAVELRPDDRREHGLERRQLGRRRRRRRHRHRRLADGRRQGPRRVRAGPVR